MCSLEHFDRSDTCRIPCFILVGPQRTVAQTSRLDLDYELRSLVSALQVSDEVHQFGDEVNAVLV